MKNFTLAIQKEFAPYGISIQLVTPMYVRTKMNNYSTTVMAGSILFPDVESYTKSAVFCLGKTNETTGYWSHGIQVSVLLFRALLLWHFIQISCSNKYFNIFRMQYGAMRLVPSWVRTLGGASLNRKFRKEYFEQQKISDL